MSPLGAVTKATVAKRSVAKAVTATLKDWFCIEIFNWPPFKEKFRRA
jgi:hypothetical protein